MSKLLVSIIINNYNYGRFLGFSVESALSQDYSPVEVIVVDDGSSDNSSDVIAKYGEQIRGVLQKKFGASESS